MSNDTIKIILAAKKAKKADFLSGACKGLICEEQCT